LREYFKQEWKKLSSRTETTATIRTWTCSCPYFACCEPIVERVNFFHNVARSRTSPFWIHPQLVLRPGFRVSTKRKHTGLSDEEDSSELLEDSEDDASIDAATADEDHLADLDDDLEELNAFELDL
jgi:hypothetical protein